ncbi:hypothetical protein U1Q18_010658 [Sarracenia purpurea var. burkii]
MTLGASMLDCEPPRFPHELRTGDAAQNEAFMETISTDGPRYSVIFSVPFINLAGFSFKEVGSLNSSNDKILCCHFSSDGKLLASAGHGKKV